MDSDLLEVANTYTRHYNQRSDDEFWAWQEVLRMQLALSGIWLERESPVLMRWRALMQKYGFMGGTREPLSKHPDCWF